MWTIDLGRAWTLKQNLRFSIQRSPSQNTNFLWKMIFSTDWLENDIVSHRCDIKVGKWRLFGWCSRVSEIENAKAQNSADRPTISKKNGQDWCSPSVRIVVKTTNNRHLILRLNHPETLRNVYEIMLLNKQRWLPHILFVRQVVYVFAAISCTPRNSEGEIYKCATDSGNNIGIETEDINWIVCITQTV